MKSFCLTPTDLKEQQFDHRVARAMSLWCFCWLAIYAADYIQLTWQLVSDLKGVPWILLISPSFWIWLAVFSLSALVTERLITVSWHRFEKELSLGKVAALIVGLPFILWLMLGHLCPYIYPVVAGTLRLVPVIGGRAF